MDLDAKQLLSRHLQDCVPAKQTSNCSNLHTDNKSSHSHEIEIDFVGLIVNKILVSDYEAHTRDETTSGGNKQASKL